MLLLAQRRTARDPEVLDLFLAQDLEAPALGGLGRKVDRVDLDHKGLDQRALMRRSRKKEKLSFRSRQRKSLKRLHHRRRMSRYQAPEGYLRRLLHLRLTRRE